MWDWALAGGDSWGRHRGLEQAHGCVGSIVVGGGGARASVWWRRRLGLGRGCLVVRWLEQAHGSRMGPAWYGVRIGAGHHGRVGTIGGGLPVGVGDAAGDAGWVSGVVRAGGRGALLGLEQARVHLGLRGGHRRVGVLLRSGGVCGWGARLVVGCRVGAVGRSSCCCRSGLTVWWPDRRGPVVASSAGLRVCASTVMVGSIVCGVLLVAVSPVPELASLPSPALAC